MTRIITVYCTANVRNSSESGITPEQMEIIRAIAPSDVIYDISLNDNVLKFTVTSTPAEFKYITFQIARTIPGIPINFGAYIPSSYLEEIDTPVTHTPVIVYKPNWFMSCFK